MKLFINSNKDFDFVDWVKTPRLFYFCSVKFHYVKETHKMLIAFWRTLVKIVVASQHKRQRKRSLSRFVENMKTPTRADSDLKVHVLHYANELLVRVRLAFQKLLKTHQTSRNNKKLLKTGFGYDKAFFKSMLD